MSQNRTKRLSGEIFISEWKYSVTVRNHFRIFTVILYMFSVSLGAILLSLYYVFLWKNPHTMTIDTRVRRVEWPYWSWLMHETWVNIKMFLNDLPQEEQHSSGGEDFDSQFCNFRITWPRWSLDWAAWWSLIAWSTLSLIISLLTLLNWTASTTTWESSQDMTSPPSPSSPGVRTSTTIRIQANVFLNIRKWQNYIRHISS